MTARWCRRHIEPFEEGLTQRRLCLVPRSSLQQPILTIIPGPTCCLAFSFVASHDIIRWFVPNSVASHSTITIYVLLRRLAFDAAASHLALSTTVRFICRRSSSPSTLSVYSHFCSTRVQTCNSWTCANTLTSFTPFPTGSRSLDAVQDHANPGKIHRLSQREVSKRRTTKHPWGTVLFGERVREPHRTRFWKDAGAQTRSIISFLANSIIMSYSSALTQVKIHLPNCVAYIPAVIVANRSVCLEPPRAANREGNEDLGPNLVNADLAKATSKCIWLLTSSPWPHGTLLLRIDNTSDHITSTPNPHLYHSNGLSSTPN